MILQQHFIQRALRFDPFDHLVVHQVIQRRESRRTADRMAAESGDMPQRGIFLQGVHHLVTRDERPEGHAPAEGLGQTDDVGRDAVFLHGEQAARAAHAGLYLVENQQRADFVAASARASR